MIPALAAVLVLAPLPHQDTPRAPQGTSAEAVQVGDGADGMLRDGRPVTRGWQALIRKDSLDGWLYERGYWTISDGVITGVSPGTPHHHYMLSNRDWSDFEMHVDVKLIGYNSGVCIRVAPETYDSVPGYQVDMGDGYWGCLWEEHRRSRRIIEYPVADADRILHKDDWNHYFVRAVGHHIAIWLNGVKTGETDDPQGILSGPLGFQLCHAGAETASFRNMFIKTRFSYTDATGQRIDVRSRSSRGTAPAPPANPIP